MKQTSRTVMIEYAANKSFPLSFSTQADRFGTTTELFQQVIEKLSSLNQSKGLSLNIQSIVSVQTKNKDLKTDYLLSLNNKTLEFLADGSYLVPYFAKQITSSSQSSAILEDYEFLAKLGQGGFATVFLARKKQTGKFFAVKQIKKKNLTPRDQKNLLQERNTMIDVDSPFVAKLYTAFQTKEYCYIVMDYMAGGDLLTAIENRASITEETAKFFIAEIALGLDALHSKNVLYRDLKPENVLIGLDGHVVLSDFGLSKKEVQDELNFSICGTPHFIAPEVYKKTGYTHLADYFALGVVAFEFVTGNLPFMSESIQTLAKMIVRDPVQFGSGYSAEFMDFIEKILAKKPSERLGAQKGVKEILSHPWFKNLNIENLASKKIKVPKMNKSTLKLSALPKGFNIEKPVSENILDELNVAPKADERSHLSCFSFYSASPVADKKEPKQRGLNDTDETQLIGETSPKKVTNYAIEIKPQFAKKLFS